MCRRFHVLLPCWLVAVALAGCERPAPSVVRAAASSPAVAAASASAVQPAVSMAAAAVAAVSTPARGAPDDSKEALMQEAFPDWAGRHVHLMTVTPPEAKDGPLLVNTSPEQVLAIDEAHRVLVVSGSPSDDNGRPSAMHVDPGYLGAVWFERREARWYVTLRRDTILWDGSAGSLGTVKAFDLGPAHPAVSVDSGGCWQGSCVSFLQVLVFDRATARVVLPSVGVLSETRGASDDCDWTMSDTRDPATPVASGLDPDSCFDVEAKWHAEFASTAAATSSSVQTASEADFAASASEPPTSAPRPAAWPDIVVVYEGHEIVAKPPKGKLSVEPVEETLVMRYIGDHYVRVSGRDRTHAI